MSVIFLKVLACGALWLAVEFVREQYIRGGRKDMR